jgi:hypothetical protein
MAARRDSRCAAVVRQVRPDGSLALPKTKRVRRIVVPALAQDALATVPEQ